MCSFGTLFFAWLSSQMAVDESLDRAVSIYHPVWYASSPPKTFESRLSFSPPLMGYWRAFIGQSVVTIGDGCA